MSFGAVRVAGVDAAQRDSCDTDGGWASFVRPRRCFNAEGWYMNTRPLGHVLVANYSEALDDLAHRTLHGPLRLRFPTPRPTARADPLAFGTQRWCTECPSGRMTQIVASLRRQNKRDGEKLVGEWR